VPEPAPTPAEDDSLFRATPGFRATPDSLPPTEPDDAPSVDSSILGAEEFRRSLAPPSDSIAPVPDPSPPPEPARAPREPIRLVVHDTAGDLLRATREARLAIREEGADAVVGPLRSVTSIAAGGVAQAQGVPLLAPLATDPGIGEIGPYVLPFEPDPRELAGPLARFAIEILGERRFGVLMPRDGQSSAFEQAFREAVAAAGGEVVLSIAFDPEESDFRRLLDRLDEANVDAVYVPGGPTSLERLAPQLDFYDFSRRILGHGGWTNLRLLDPGNLALEGALFAVPAADDPDSEFRRRLRESVWRESREEVTRFHLGGYRAMASLLLAMDEGARGGEEIVETLRRRSEWPVRPEGEAVRVLTFRDGVLGPASWSVGFDLVPKLPPEPPEEEEDPEAAKIDPSTAAADTLHFESLDFDPGDVTPFDR
jgi:ABC-type branched-subunit amino acid transport system substrate-binding protein